MDIISLGEALINFTTGGKQLNLDYFHENNVLHSVNIVSTAFRILFAIIIGGILGYEREIKNRPAGFRTYMLVCIGSALVMITNQYIYETFKESNIDPGRLGAQVISGIGFLGAGTIIVTKRNQIKGLTTAAGLWAAACLGLTIGIGFYTGAVIGTLGIILALITLQKVDAKIRKMTNLIDIYVEFSNITNISSFITFLQLNNLEAKDLSLNKGQIPGCDNIALILTLKTHEKTDHTSLIQLLGQAEGIQYIEEL